MQGRCSITQVCTNAAHLSDDCKAYNQAQLRPLELRSDQTCADTNDQFRNNHCRRTAERLKPDCVIAVADQVAADQSLADQTSAFRPVQTRYMESMCRPGTNQIGVVHIRNPTRSAQECKIQ